ncbi:zinc finger protein ZAT12-like [Euphorbia lathyris]|uniref:zinc finger protein ZAT12-like n=1 Tax=Euphorbia lathyris TaxID=212925 RepID=UPI0033132589
MKRSFHNLHPEVVDSISMANCLMLLSQGRETMSFPNFEALKNNNNVNLITSSNRVFECKTCNRQFPSFQALGGHRASHKKPRLMAVDGGNSSSETQSSSSTSPAKPKTHECSICGLEFAIGQALGGHMRRHRAAINDHQNAEMVVMKPSPTTTPIVKKSNSRRVLCLDLNLTPFENDLELFKIGKTAPMVDCFI